MPKKASTPVKASRRVAVEEDEEDEEEVVVATSAKKTSASVAKSAKNGKANGKVAAPVKKSAKTDEDSAYAPNTNSMRDFIMRAMKKGGTSTEIKKRAARFAEKKGIDDLSDVKAYKNFDVAYFAKFLKGKGFDVEIDEEGDSYTLSV